MSDAIDQAIGAMNRAAENISVHHSDIRRELRLAVAALSEEQARQDGMVLVPAVPSAAHIDSICLRYDYSFGLLKEGDPRKTNIRCIAHQMYEEVTGQGFYKITAANEQQP